MIIVIDFDTDGIGQKDKSLSTLVFIRSADLDTRLAVVGEA